MGTSLSRINAFFSSSVAWLLTCAIISGLFASNTNACVSPGSTTADSSSMPSLEVSVTFAGLSPALAATTAHGDSQKSSPTNGTNRQPALLADASTAAQVDSSGPIGPTSPCMRSNLAPSPAVDASSSAMPVPPDVPVVAIGAPVVLPSEEPTPSVSNALLSTPRVHALKARPSAVVGIDALPMRTEAKSAPRTATAREARGFGTGYSAGSSPNSVPTASSMASKGSGRTVSPRSARSTVT